MKTIAKQEICQALVDVGIKRGDVILVHSDISLIGSIRGCSNKEEYLKILFETFFDVIEKDGTLAVPSHFHDYGRWHTAFDIKKSPVSKAAGVFAQYVTALPGAIRSLNPLVGLAAIGRRAEYICRGGTTSAFGVDSAFDRLMQSEGKIVFFGVTLRFMTFVNYVEHAVGVPHRYNKFFTVPIYEDGRKIDLPVCSQVRYLDFDIEYDVKSFDSKFEEAGIVSKVKLGMGEVRCVSCKAVFEFLKEKLKKDFFYLLKRPPKFIAGKIPMDGETGPAPESIHER